MRWYGLAYVAGILLGWLYARRIIQNASLWRNGTAPSTWRSSRLPALGGRRHRAWRAHRLHPLLRSRLHPRESRPRDPVLERRHVLPWGPSRHDPGDNHLCAKERDPPLEPVRRRGSSGADRALLRAHRQFHQWRTLGPPVLDALGGRLPDGRPLRPPSESALRGGPGGHCASRRARLVRLSPQSLENARPRHRHLRLRLCREPHFRGVLPRTGRTDRLFAGDWLTMGMVLSLPMALVGIWAIARARSAAAAA